MKENKIQKIDSIIDRYADMVYRLALNQMKNEPDAQDVFQEVFLRLVKSAPQFESEEHIKAWLIRVTINCSKTNLMSAWRRHTQALENDECIAEQKEESIGLLEELKKLPKKYRTVLYLFYYEELSIKEIAETTNQKEATIKSQLSRGRKLLKGELDRMGGVY